MTTRRLLAALTAAALALSGCGITASDIPLPGGGVDGETYRLTAVFTDALNLPDKAHVRLNGVDIGTVTEIVPKDFTAHVRMDVLKRAELPVGTAAELRQATPLGDVFVALQPPAQVRPDTRLLASGDVIPVTRTEAAASVEDTLAAMSALVNGGGLGNLKTITRELAAATKGRGRQAAHLLKELSATVTTLNGRTAEIDRILRASRELTGLAIKRRGTIDAGLAELPPAIKVIADQTGKLTRVLTKAAKAGEYGDALLARVSTNVKRMLRDAGPVLDGLAELDTTYGPNLETMLRFAELLGGATRGESGAGHGRLYGFDLTDSGLLNPGTVPDGLESLTDNLAELIESLGGPR